MLGKAPIYGVTPGSKEAAVLVMSEIDRLPKKWRALVHEYGWDIVSRFINEGASVSEADDALFMWRESRQIAQLQTNYSWGKTSRRVVADAMTRKAA